MNTKIINGRVITILREHVKMKQLRRQKIKGIVYMCGVYNDEIICWYCGKSKFISRQSLNNGTALLHRTCAKLVTYAGKTVINNMECYNSVEPIDIVLKEIRNSLNTSRVAQRLGFTTLSLDDIKKLVCSNCHYCGTSVNGKRVRRATINCMGIDRVDSAQGYIVENCVPCCSICNRAKNDMDVNEFKDWIRRLVKFNSGMLEQR